MKIQFAANLDRWGLMHPIEVPLVIRGVRVKVEKLKFRVVVEIEAGVISLAPNARDTC